MMSLIKSSLLLIIIIHLGLVSTTEIETNLHVSSLNSILNKVKDIYKDVKNIDKEFASIGKTLATGFGKIPSDINKVINSNEFINGIRHVADDIYQYTIGQYKCWENEVNVFRHNIKNKTTSCIMPDHPVLNDILFSSFKFPGFGQIFESICDLISDIYRLISSCDPIKSLMNTINQLINLIPFKEWIYPLLDWAKERHVGEIYKSGLTILFHDKSATNLLEVSSNLTKLNYDSDIISSVFTHSRSDCLHFSETELQFLVYHSATIKSDINKFKIILKIMNEVIEKTCKKIEKFTQMILFNQQMAEITPIENTSWLKIFKHMSSGVFFYLIKVFLWLMDLITEEIDVAIYNFRRCVALHD